jgi:hypothetical protein
METGSFCWRLPQRVAEGLWKKGGAQGEFAGEYCPASVRRYACTDTETPSAAREGDNVKAAVWYGRQDVRIENVSEPPAPPQGQLQVEVV